MTTIESAATTIRMTGAEHEVEEAQLAAISFLARYNGRTLVAYRHDLRGFFQRATNHGIAVMAASRAHIELFRAWMEDRGLAASTIDPAVGERREGPILRRRDGQRLDRRTAHRRVQSIGKHAGLGLRCVRGPRIPRGRLAGCRLDWMATPIRW